MLRPDGKHGSIYLSPWNTHEGTRGAPFRPKSWCRNQTWPNPSPLARAPVKIPESTTDSADASHHSVPDLISQEPA